MGKDGKTVKPKAHKTQRTKPFDIPNVLESLAYKVKSGKITLHEAAKELCKAGWTPFIDDDETKELLNLWTTAQSNVSERKIQHG